MSHFLDRLSYFTQERESYSDGHGSLTHEDRTWEEGYRQRWQHDKIVRSTHGVNCTGSCRAAARAGRPIPGTCTARTG